MKQANNSKHTHLGWLAKFLISMGVICFLTSCTPTFRLGTLPKTEALDTLSPSVSTSADVLRVVGQPQGYGVVVHRAGAPTGDVWFYRYQIITGGGGESKTKSKILFVFIDRDIYEGYLWYSSITELQRR